MKAPWNEPRGYQTLAERQAADPLHVDYDEDVKQAWAQHLARDKSRDQLTLPSKWRGQNQAFMPRAGHGWREDARIFLSIGAFIGFGAGIVVGVWLATR